MVNPTELWLTIMQNMFHCQLGLPLLWLKHHGKLHSGSSQNGISNLAPSKSPIFFDLVESDNVFCWMVNHGLFLVQLVNHYITLYKFHYIKHLSKPRWWNHSHGVLMTFIGQSSLHGAQAMVQSPFLSSCCLLRECFSDPWFGHDWENIWEMVGIPETDATSPDILIGFWLPMTQM